LYNLVIFRLPSGPISGLFLSSWTKVSISIRSWHGKQQNWAGEEPQAIYNRLKTLVNQVRNLGSIKWDDHEMVKVILRSLVFLNSMQIQLIRDDPRYKLMSLE
jgi:hypothetical protein